MSHLNLVYMAKPPYGGWVSFTTHLALKYNLDLYKGKKNRKIEKWNLIKTPRWS